MVKKVLISAGLVTVVTLGLSASAWAQANPNPNPNAPGHVGTACTNVIARNPNAGPNGHISATGGTNLAAVGAAMCGLGG